MMLKRVFFLLALLSLASAGGAAAQSVVPDSKPAIGPAKPELFNRIIANQKKAEASLDLYERTERVETRKSSSDPNPPVIKVSRVIPSGTGLVRIPIAEDGKPTDSAAYRPALQNVPRPLALLTHNNR